VARGRIGEQELREGLGGGVVAVGGEVHVEGALRAPEARAGKWCLMVKVPLMVNIH
jgi:hypothetical protein